MVIFFTGIGQLMPMNMSQNQMSMAINLNQMRPQPPMFMPNQCQSGQQLLKPMLQMRRQPSMSMPNQCVRRISSVSESETSDRYGKKLKKDTSQGFMQLLDVGSIDGTFEGPFLYFSKTTINQH